VEIKEGTSWEIIHAHGNFSTASQVKSNNAQSAASKLQDKL